MTSYNNHKMWQDVYHKKKDNVELYIKLQKSFDEKAVVIQLKCSEDY